MEHGGNPFAFLDEADAARLHAGGRRLSFAREETLLEEGAKVDAMFVIRSGAARVERASVGRGIAVARLEPGDVFGELSFLENVGATASVIADADTVEVEVLDRATIDELLADPRFAAGLYQSLALTLARRFREAAALVPPMLVEDVPQVSRFHAERSSLAGADGLPPVLVEAVETFKTSMLAVDRALARSALAPADAQARVSETCDALCLVLLAHVRREDVAAGAYAFRETFPLLMQSAMVDRSFAKPRGYAGDYETIERMYDDEPAGAGRLGPLIDRWFLDSRSARAAKNRRGFLTDVIRSVTAEATDFPVPVTSLASGPARELLDLLVQPDAPDVHATCIDIDPAALAYARGLAEEHGVAGKMTFARDNVVHLSAGRGKTALAPQQLIYSVGLIDYLEDAYVVALLSWAHDVLLPGGTLIVGNFDTSSPDRAWMDHILEWPLIYRSEDDLRRLFRESTFAGAPVVVHRETQGVQLFAVARRPG